MGRMPRNLTGVSVKECARQLGVSDTAIHKAIKAGRCSKHADGSVDVEAIRQGMSATADPFRGGQRQAGVFGAMPMGPVVTGHGDAAPAATPSAPAQHPAVPKASAQSSLLDARTLTEQAKAERHQIDLAKIKGTVAEIEPMTRAVHDAMVSARSELLALPDRLTPMVTPETDAGKIYSIIEAEAMRICETLRDKLQLLAQQNATATV